MESPWVQWPQSKRGGRSPPSLTDWPRTWQFLAKLSKRGGSPFPGLPSQEGEGRQKQHKGGGGYGSWSLRSQHTHTDERGPEMVRELETPKEKDRDRHRGAETLRETLNTGTDPRGRESR